MSDRILVTRLAVFARHGVLPEEEVLGQRFYVSLDCGLDLSEAGRTDDVSHTVSYADLAALALDIAGNRRFRLIEALAEAIAAAILSGFPAIETVRVRVDKPSAPVPAILDGVSVEIFRGRGTARGAPVAAGLATRAYLGIGSNIGDKAARLDAAVERLSRYPGIRVVARSHDYRTPPWGDTDQDWFLNGALAVETDLSPHALLTACLSVEAAMGRVRERRWGPRVIDIDVLHYEGAQVDDARLVLPHRFVRERAFVLVPLAEIAPDLTIGGERVADALAKLDRGGIERVE
ncbi:MAG: hypothetical protein COT28_12530 [Methylobacterium sp. CG08_land_8_20_14_0_20_71_15]|uniref:Bifunctional folate synthesis protein n=2 Tax=Pseudomonadota TaxID=1224 RepID=A0ABQ4SR09_9HYPH|nr:MAG: hypothetical protein COT56_03535 [Methylobacterium sp. CG09_land_8_20_14_0_10_71_15]PIU13136.1 MAG: hypothetical protein COT28_12530 [Methylobacterium sp. CG08_land_8_20_14_0_20_71_15]GBU15995.1 7,8-dihydroneopterin aldolase [Methylobacterium sp.]GJE05627.1 Bifunctional folate synthesis protein [Methylobacterium jeotgali]